MFEECDLNDSVYTVDLSFDTGHSPRRGGGSRRRGGSARPWRRPNSAS